MQWSVKRPTRQGFGCLGVLLWRLPPSTQWEVRSACPPAQRAAMQMVATKAAAQMGPQSMRGCEQAATPEAAMWAAVAVTGTRAAVWGAAKR